jgi:D-sedoheptulose 7-phosphate isomerase
VFDFKNLGRLINMNKIADLFERSLELKTLVLENGSLSCLDDMARAISEAIMSGSKLMICGNGGSAADAQHLAAELLVRLRPDHNRRGLPAIALAQDVSTITACGNDFGFDELYARMVEALGSPGDVLLVITTSGRSKNINKALIKAKENGIATFGFLGNRGGESLSLCDASFLVPSDETGRVQEVHITAGHALMEGIEDRLLNCGFMALGNQVVNN